MLKTGASPFENKLKCFWCGDEIEGVPYFLGGHSAAEELRLIIKKPQGEYYMTNAFAVTPSRIFCSNECRTQFVETALKEYGAKLDAEMGGTE